MCTTLFYYTCVYIYSLLNSFGYWTLNKYYYYYYYYYYKRLNFFVDVNYILLQLLGVASAYFGNNL